MANRAEELDPDVCCINDLKFRASVQLPQMYRGYYNERSMDLLTLRDNEAAFERYRIRPKILVDVNYIDTSSEFFWYKGVIPPGPQPYGCAQISPSRWGGCHISGGCCERNLNGAIILRNLLDRGCYGPRVKNPVCHANVCFERPYNYITALEAHRGYVHCEISVQPSRIVFFTYKTTFADSGCKALFLSVDNAVLGKRLNEFRNKFELSVDMTWPNILSHSSDLYNINVSRY